MLWRLSSFHLEDHESAIIGEWSALGEPIDFAKDKIGDLGGISFVMVFDELAEASDAEELAFGIHGFGNAIGVKDEDIAGFERDAPLVVLNFIENSEREASKFDLVAAIILVKEGLRLACVGNAELLAAFLPSGKASGHEAAFDAPLANQKVHLAEHLCGLELLRRETAHDTDGHSTVERRGCAFTADVTKSNAELLRTVAEEVVEIAADLAGRDVASGDVEAIVFRGRGTEESALDAFGGLEIAFHAGFAVSDLLIQAGIFDRHREICREDGESLDMILGEIVKLRALKIEYANNLSLVNHRDGELGASFGIHHEVARIRSYIGDDDGLAKRGSGTDDAFRGGDAELPLNALAVFYVDAMTEDLLLFVVQHETENLVVDYALHQFGGAAEHLLHVEDRADFAADLVQNQKSLGLGADLLEQTSVFDGDGEAIGEHGQDVLLVLGEVIQMLALNIEDTDNLGAKYEGNCEFGANAVDGIDVSRILGNIADANRVASAGCGTGNSLPNGNSEVFREARGIADGETMLEIGAIAIDHQHAEEFVVDVFLDENGSFGQDLIEVQRRVDLLADFSEGCEDFRIFCGQARFGFRVGRFHECSIITGECLAPCGFSPEQKIYKVRVSTRNLARPARRKLMLGYGELFPGGLGELQDTDVGEIAVAFVKIKAVADDKFVRNGEAGIIGANIGDAAF